MIDNCNPCNDAPVKIIQLGNVVPPTDFWRSNSGVDLPDGTNDTTEEITRVGPIAVGTTTGTANKIATFVGDIDVQGQIDPNSIVFSDAPVGVVTVWDSVTQNFYKFGVIGVQRPLVMMPKTDAVNAVQTRKADGVTVVTNVDTLNRRFGINVASPQAALDVSGAAIFRPVTLANFTANGTVGTAAATVDIASELILQQTTANILLTLPNPTITQAGRLLLVGNAGAAPTSINGNVVASGKGIPFVWSGAAWIPLGASGGTSDDFWRSGAAASTMPDGATDLTESIVHNGRVGIGSSTAFTDATAVAAALDVAGAEVLRTIALGNFAANAAIGLAAATVDIASTISINQTAGNVALTLPNPTNAQSGRVLNISNVGTAQAKVAGQYITPKTAQSYVWTGSAWTPLGDNPDVITVGASRNLQPTDHLKTILATAAITLTCPANIGYLLLRIRQQTAGAVVTVAGAAGVTVVAPFGASSVGIAGTSIIVETYQNTMWIE